MKTRWTVAIAFGVIVTITTTSCVFARPDVRTSLQSWYDDGFNQARDQATQELGDAGLDQVQQSFSDFVQVQTTQTQQSLDNAVTRVQEDSTKAINNRENDYIQQLNRNKDKLTSGLQQKFNKYVEKTKLETDQQVSDAVTQALSDVLQDLGNGDKQ